MKQFGGMAPYTGRTPSSCGIGIVCARRNGCFAEHPTRPVRIIFGFPAGGGSDAIARLMGQWLSERLGQPFVIENRPGNVTNIATEAVIRAPADGYVKQCLVPALRRGETVLMDNLPVHKVAGVAEAIEAAGATLIYLPKYSPDLNPIELAFSKLKSHLRKAAEHTIPRLLRRIGCVARDFSARECTNFFRHAGYVRT